MSGTRPETVLRMNLHSKYWGAGKIKMSKSERSAQGPWIGFDLLSFPLKSKYFILKRISKLFRHCGKFFLNFIIAFHWQSLIVLYNGIKCFTVQFQSFNHPFSFFILWYTRVSLVAAVYYQIHYRKLSCQPQQTNAF